LPLWNSFKYLNTYATLHNWSPSLETKTSTNILDQWIENQTNYLCENIAKNLEKYDIPAATRLIAPYIDDLSRWYIRQSRDRFVNGDTEALQTLWQVFIKFSQSCAPIIPFITDYFLAIPYG